MSLFESITILKSQLDSAEKEVQALQSGKKASSSRARKSLMRVKSGSHELRKQNMTHTKSMDVKKRAPKKETVEGAVEGVVEEEAVVKKKIRKKKVEVEPVD